MTSADYELFMLSKGPRLKGRMKFYQRFGRCEITTSHI